MTLAGILIVVAVGGLSATPALGSTWSGRQLTGEAAKVTMFGMSCPTTLLCVAVGGNNTIASSTNPSGGLESWNVVYAGAGAQPTGGGIFPGRQIRGVSCPSPQLCVAVTQEGLINTTTEPTGPAAAWAVADLGASGPNTHLYGVSCPSPTFCAASAGKGRVAVSTNPTGGAAAWTVTQLEQPAELRGISCLSALFCVAVGDDGESPSPRPGDEGVILSSTSPLSGVWQRVQMSNGQGSMYGVSCASPTLCVSGNQLGNLLVSTNPLGTAAAWPTTDGGGAVQITDTDCISTSLCVAIDNNADVLTTTDPTGGPGAWTFTNILPYPGVDETEANAMYGISCPTTAFCAIAANKGQIFTSSDPFAASPLPVKTNGKKKNRKRPKRPRVKLATVPQPGLEIDGARIRIRYFFFAMHHAQVRGFSCKLDRRPIKRCRSPKSYKVETGKHVFRVRAIGWTGLKGPPVVHRFEVCHPTFPPQCIGKPVNPLAR